MDKKFILSTVYKNRFLILSGIVLVAGNIVGITVLKTLPQSIAKNLSLFISQASQTFFGDFLNCFCMPFITLLFVFLAGFSAVGKFTVFFTVFINGILFGFQNGINYMFLGTNYIFTAIISYFTATVYFGFLIIIMAESSIFSSKHLIELLKNETSEKLHYNAKNQTIKFITFTAVFAIFSAISAYFTPFFQEFL